LILCRVSRYISEFSIWAIAGGEIIFSSDPRNMSAFQRKVWFNTEILAVYNDTSGFADITEYDDTAAILEPAAAAAAGELRYAAAPINSCALTKQLSAAGCAPGVSFGCFANKTMWTSAGCRGVFSCGGVDSVVCDVYDTDKTHLTHHCPCKGGTVPPAPPAHHGAKDPTPQVWMRPTADGGAAVVLHNAQDSATAKITVDFTKIPKRGWSAGSSLKVRDLWAHAELGAATGKFTSAAIPPHGSMFLKLTAK
jgi:hypothetical protein